MLFLLKYLIKSSKIHSFEFILNKIDTYSFIAFDLTIDRSFAAQFEHTLAIDSHGNVKILTC